MPNTKSKGGKHFKRKKGATQIKRELVEKQEGMQYAIVNKMLGNERLELSCMDGTKRMGKIRGTMRKRVWINIGDLVLVSIREFDNLHCDVLLKYTPDEVRQLKANNQISEATHVNEDNDGINFRTAMDDREEGSESSSDDDIDEEPEEEEEFKPSTLRAEDIDNI